MEDQAWSDEEIAETDYHRKLYGKGVDESSYSNDTARSVTVE